MLMRPGGTSKRSGRELSIHEGNCRFLVRRGGLGVTNQGTFLSAHVDVAEREHYAPCRRAAEGGGGAEDGEEQDVLQLRQRLLGLLRRRGDDAVILHAAVFIY